MRVMGPHVSLHNVQLTSGQDMYLPQGISRSGQQLPATPVPTSWGTHHSQANGELVTLTPARKTLFIILHILFYHLLDINVQGYLESHLLKITELLSAWAPE